MNDDFWGDGSKARQNDYLHDYLHFLVLEMAITCGIGHVCGWTMHQKNVIFNVYTTGPFKLEGKIILKYIMGA